MSLGVQAPRWGTETFSQSHPWWTRADHDALLTVLRRVRPKTVLEFGPGVSTLCMLEGGVNWVDTFENRTDWYDFHKKMFSEHRSTVHQYLYRHGPVISLPPVRLKMYDLGFVDGPRWAKDRRPELVYAREHCRAVAVHDFNEPNLRTILGKEFPEASWTAWQYVTNPGEAIGLLLRNHSGQ